MGLGSGESGSSCLFISTDYYKICFQTSAMFKSVNEFLQNWNNSFKYYLLNIPGGLKNQTFKTFNQFNS
jgi:hypothetical protein